MSAREREPQAMYLATRVQSPGQRLVEHPRVQVEAPDVTVLQLETAIYQE